MLRRTKIIATLGPATDDPATLRQMIEAGLNVVRLNFSHSDHAAQRKRIEQLREIIADCGRFVGIIGDLQGPKIRIRRFENSRVTLLKGDDFFLDSSLGDDAGNSDGVSVAYDDLHKDVVAGNMLLLNDGQITLRVERIEGTRIHTRVEVGGVLSDHKGINRQGGGLSAPALTVKDREDICFAAELAMDFVAVSFVRSAADVEETRSLIRAAGGTPGQADGYAQLRKSIQNRADKVYALFRELIEIPVADLPPPVPAR